MSDEKPLYKTKTLKELGNTFPIPVCDASGNKLPNQTFQFYEWDMETEEKLSKFQEKNRNVGVFTNKILCNLTSEFCGEPFDKLDEIHKKVKISQLEYANAMYLYIYLRYEELGEEVVLHDLQCRNCRTMLKKVTSSLNELEVRCKDQECDLEVTYELFKPVVVQNKTITKVQLRPAKWLAIEGLTPESANNSAKLKQAFLTSAIHKAYEGDQVIENFYDVQTFIKKLKKADIEKLMRLSLENNAGPDMELQIECPSCQGEFVHNLNWNYGFFFDSSSL